MARQWVFYISAIVVGITFVLSLGLQESRPSLLLERKVEALRKTSAIGVHQTHNTDEVLNVKQFVDVTVIRPLRLLFTEPIIILVSERLQRTLTQRTH